jgi:hypothetical protein
VLQHHTFHTLAQLSVSPTTSSRMPGSSPGRHGVSIGFSTNPCPLCRSTVALLRLLVVGQTLLLLFCCCDSGSHCCCCLLTQLLQLPSRPNKDSQVGGVPKATLQGCSVPKATLTTLTTGLGLAEVATSLHIRPGCQLQSLAYKLLTCWNSCVTAAVAVAATGAIQQAAQAGKAGMCTPVPGMCWASHTDIARQICCDLAQICDHLPSCWGQSAQHSACTVSTCHTHASNCRCILKAGGC